MGPTCMRDRERSGSVVEFLTRDREAAGSSLTGVTVLWSLSKIHLSSLSTGSTQEDLSLERLLMGRKESNQTNYMCVCVSKDLNRILPSGFNAIMSWVEFLLSGFNAIMSWVEFLLSGFNAIMSLVEFLPSGFNAK